jgi:hypothetical protein
MTLAVGAVLVLALALAAVAINSSSLLTRTRWLLCLLALVATLLAALRRQGVL